MCVRNQFSQVVVDRIAKRMPQAAPSGGGKAFRDGARAGRVLVQEKRADIGIAKIGVMQRLNQRRMEWR